LYQFGFHGNNGAKPNFSVVGLINVWKPSLTYSLSEKCQDIPIESGTYSPHIAHRGLFPIEIL
jgi:hypothetical protein